MGPGLAASTVYLKSRVRMAEDQRGVRENTDFAPGSGYAPRLSQAELAPNALCSSGIKREYIPITANNNNNNDLSGNDYRNFELATMQPETCWQACMWDERCKAWTYVRPSVGAYPTCYLKNAYLRRHRCKRARIRCKTAWYHHSNVGVCRLGSAWKCYSQPKCRER
jgi:hypothetical protein